MEYWNNIICINASSLIKSDDNPNGFLSRDGYNKLAYRNIITVVRRAHRGAPALIAFDSLRKDIKQWVIENYGDPYQIQKEQKEVKELTIKELGYIIEIDEAARDFYAEYIHENGLGLATEFQEQYTNTASILNAWIKKYSERINSIKRANGTVKNVATQEVLWYNNHKDCLNQKYPHSLPGNDRRFIEKVKEYQDKGYVVLISDKLMNQNRTKIKGQAAEWIIANWANPLCKLTIMQLWEEYNKKAQEHIWPSIETHVTLNNFLNRPDIKRLWLGARYGELNAKAEYTRQHRTLLPTMRDSLWYSDGTKLNFYYLDENGKVSTCMVYEVMDVYSETFLGYHISKSEDFEAQYMAYKMALKFAGQKPYEIKYDNQSGHKKLENGDFLKKISRISHNTAPYNGNSKTIESAFGRFQSQFLHKEWFFTGQNITAKKQESRSNIDFIMANKNNLPTLEEVKSTYLNRRNEWNKAKHYSTGVSHIEMYRNSRNPEAVKLDIWDMIDIFWITTKDPSTYRPSGIEIQVKNQKYAYEVLNADGMPNLEFMRDNVGNKFFVKYDPEDMALAQLYEQTANGLRYVATAQPYITIHRGKQDQEDREAAFMKAMELANKAERLRMQNDIEEIMERQGVHPAQHGLVMPNIKGVNSSRKVQKKQKGDGYGSYVKKLSNVVVAIDEDDDEVNQFKLY